MSSIHRSKRRRRFRGGSCTTTSSVGNRRGSRHTAGGGSAAMTAEHRALQETLLRNLQQPQQQQPTAQDSPTTTANNNGDLATMIPNAPTFFPTVQDMEGNALVFIERIRPIAQRYGICKIVPPPGWNPPFCARMDDDHHLNSNGTPPNAAAVPVSPCAAGAPPVSAEPSDTNVINESKPPNDGSKPKPRRFSTKQQVLRRLQEGVSFDDGLEYTAAEYQKQASFRAKLYRQQHYPDHDFWVKHERQEQQEPQDLGRTPALDSNTQCRRRRRRRMTPASLERDYWDLVENCGNHRRDKHQYKHDENEQEEEEEEEGMVVEYGNDVDTTLFGSGFPLSQRGRSSATAPTTRSKNVSTNEEDEDEPAFGTLQYYQETWWNLNNIPRAPDSVLRHVKVGINGINVPWLYHGSLFSTFCWHNEDNYLYSINYHHRGAPKQWYGVPGTPKDADGLERVFQSYLSLKIMKEAPDLLHHITTMFSPRLLLNAGVPVYRVLQHAGEYVVTFPRAFHGGFSLGPNVGEAVNFALHDWIAQGADAKERYRRFARPAVFSHDRLTMTMANHVLEDQKNHNNCQLLLEELERIVREELRLRQELVGTGVRDVSAYIALPPNRLDQLDEESADYDDKRLCYACKHVCFFSGVACECSQSRVSCLRHSHSMCRCQPNRRYLLVWSTENEMTNSVERVKKHCESLRAKEDKNSARGTGGGRADEVAGLGKQVCLPKVAPGVERDLKLHENYEIPLEPVRSDPI